MSEEPMPALALDDGPVAQPYGDNLQVLGYSPDEVDDVLRRIMAQFQSKGFVLHEFTFTRTRAEPLGCLSF